MSNKPVTPFLDAVRLEQEQLAQYEAEEARKEAQQRAEAPAKAAARAEIARVVRERREACEAAAYDAEKAIKVLSDALARYVANAPRIPADMRVIVSGFLNHRFQQYAPLQTYGISNHVPDLLADLYQGAK